MHFEDKRHWKAILRAWELCAAQIKFSSSQKSCRSSLCVCHFPLPCGCGGSANWGHPDRAGSPHIRPYSCSRLPIILLACHSVHLSIKWTTKHRCSSVWSDFPPRRGVSRAEPKGGGMLCMFVCLVGSCVFAFGSCGHTGTANLTYKVTLIFSRLSNHGKIRSCVGSPWLSLCLHLTRFWFVCCLQHLFPCVPRVPGLFPLDLLVCLQSL